MKKGCSAVFTGNPYVTVIIESETRKIGPEISTVLSLLKSIKYLMMMYPIAFYLIPNKKKSRGVFLPPGFYPVKHVLSLFKKDFLLELKPVIEEKMLKHSNQIVIMPGKRNEISIE